MNESPIMYLDYDRISDVLLYLTTNITLKFNVKLSFADKFGHRKSFHRESVFESKFSNVKDGYNIKRDVSFYWSIDDASNFNNGIMITIKDIFFFKLFVENKILPWYIGKTCIYGTSPDDNKIIIKGKFKPEQFVLSDYKYMEFIPIVLNYDNGRTTDYGIRIIINNPNNFIDINFNTFVAMYQLIAFTDPYAVASSMINYVKMPPYAQNVFDVRAGGYVEETIVDKGRYGGNSGSVKNFFDKI